MKNARSFLAAAVLALGVSAYAQEPQSWTVNVPFDFTVRHINLEAGRYRVQQTGSVIFLTSQNGKTANVLTTNKDYTSAPAAHSSLIFKRDGGDQTVDGGPDCVAPPAAFAINLSGTQKKL